MRFLIVYFILSFSGSLFAAQAPLQIEGLSGFSPSNCLYDDAASIASYRITNLAAIPITYTLHNISGITPLQLSSSSCLPNQTLAANGTCIYSFLIEAGQFSTPGLTDGPVLEASPFWKYTAPQGQRFNFCQTGANAPATLTSSVSALSLSVNDTSLNAALTGTPRTITITNTSTTTAQNVEYVVHPALPSGTTISPSACGNIAASGTCVLTVTPGSSATTTPLTLRTVSPNATSLSVTLNVLTWGSIYQRGYVFAVDDTTATTGSVSGKVVALEGQTPPWPFADTVWASNGLTTCNYQDGNSKPFQDCTAYDDVAAVDEDATAPPCDGSFDGACNTDYIVNTQYPAIDTSLYAAGICSTLNIDGFIDWYLPAICEMGFYTQAPNTPLTTYCGTEASPTTQNILTSLQKRGIGRFFGVYSSSTQFSGQTTGISPTSDLWSQYYLNNQNYQTHDNKADTLEVRCVRAITQPTS